MGRMLVALVGMALAACGPPSQPPPVVETSTIPSPTPSSAVPVRYVFPIAGNASYARTHHDYPASDIFAACGTAFVSPVDGVVLETSRVDTWDAKVDDGATRGGLTVSILGDDGVRYYGAHFASIEADIQAAARVSAGQKVATIGRTGNTTVCHVHFGISPVCARVADWWVRRGVIWPWSYLDAWRSKDPQSPADEIGAWQARNGCPAKP